MNTYNNTGVNKSPFQGVANSTSNTGKNSSSDESAFLGLFEGKNKSTSSNSSGSGSSSSGGSGVSVSGTGSGFLGTLGSIFSGVLGVASTAAPALVSVLPSLGVGSKSRMKELQAQANAQATVLNAQALIDQEDDKRNKELVIIGGAFLLVIVVVLVALRK